jgi:hypothetical protein
MPAQCRQWTRSGVPRRDEGQKGPRSVFFQPQPLRLQPCQGWGHQRLKTVSFLTPLILCGVENFKGGERCLEWVLWVCLPKKVNCGTCLEGIRGPGSPGTKGLRSGLWASCTPSSGSVPHPQSPPRQSRIRRTRLPRPRPRGSLERPRPERAGEGQQRSWRKGALQGDTSNRLSSCSPWGGREGRGRKGWRWGAGSLCRGRGGSCLFERLKRGRGA